MAEGPGASPADRVAGRVHERALQGESSARGDRPDGCVAAAWEGEAEASRRGEAEESTGARELARLAAEEKLPRRHRCRRREEEDASMVKRGPNRAHPVRSEMRRA